VTTYKKLGEQKYIEVHSIQELHVIERLKSGVTYVPSWNKSAACDPSIKEDARLSIESAYLWKLDQFKKRFKRHPQEWLFWVKFEKKSLEESINEQEKEIVTLYVPVDELLISLYSGWNRILLEEYWNGHKWETPCYPVLSNVKKQSWECIFNIPDDYLLSGLQGVLDRVEPEWVKNEVSPQRGKTGR
jgi:hypothetical protein